MADDAAAEAKAQREARAARHQDFLASIGLAEGPCREEFDTFTAWQRAWAEYVHARAMAGHYLRRIQQEPQQGTRNAAPAPREPLGLTRGSIDQPLRTHNAVGLAPEAVRSIRRRRAAGEDRKALAAEFGVSTAMVGLIANRLRHAHVAD